MAESYAQAIAAAKARYKVAMDEAAADAVYISREYTRSLSAVCKEIAGDDWNALRRRAQRFEESAGQTAEAAARRRETERARVQRAEAKSALKDPDQAAKVIASLPPQVLDDVYHEARLARANEDRTPAARKAAQAKATAAVAPMKRAVATTDAALGIQALKEARDDIKRAIENDAMTSQQIATADKIVNDIANLIMEAKFADA